MIIVSLPIFSTPRHMDPGHVTITCSGLWRQLTNSTLMHLCKAAPHTETTQLCTPVSIPR